jgi:hypothetical protein
LAGPPGAPGKPGVVNEQVGDRLNPLPSDCPCFSQVPLVWPVLPVHRAPLVFPARLVCLDVTVELVPLVRLVTPGDRGKMAIRDCLGLWARTALEGKREAAIIARCRELHPDTDKEVMREKGGNKCAFQDSGCEIAVFTDRLRHNRIYPLIRGRISPD